MESPSWLTYIELTGGVQGLLLLLVWLRSSKRQGWAGCFLAGLLSTASSLLFWLALHDSRQLAFVPDLIGFGPALPFLFGPLLLGYLRAVVHPHFSWRTLYWVHSLPFWLVILGHIPFYLKPYCEKRAFILDHYHQPHLDWWGLLPLLAFLAYLPALFKRIDEHDTALKNQYSTIEKRRLSWLRQLLLGLCVCYGLFGMGYFIQGLHPAGQWLAFALTGLVYTVGYQQLRHADLFAFSPTPEHMINGEPAHLLAAQRETAGNRKYEKSELSIDQSRVYAAQLNQLMNDHERYRTGQLTLSQLAGELRITPHILSQVLNQTLGVSFHEYVNGYRVEAVKQALADPKQQHFTILAVAFDAGFESKAAFNNTFRKHTGLTPSQYRRQLRSN